MNSIFILLNKNQKNDFILVSYTMHISCKIDILCLCISYIYKTGPVLEVVPHLPNGLYNIYLSHSEQSVCQS